MILNREKGLRMWGGDGVSGGGGGIDMSALAGYATQDWVGENYISIEFFSRLFQAHGTENGQQTDIDPNDMDSTITSIEALFGFWTDLYVSALGNGGSIGSSIYLSTLADVQLSSPANNQVLTYNSTIGKWVNANAQAGVTDLASLTDVTLTTPSTNQALIYDGTKWINSQLKTVNGYSLIGAGNIDASGGGTGNYLPLTGGTMTGWITMSGVGLYSYIQEPESLSWDLSRILQHGGLGIGRYPYFGSVIFTDNFGDTFIQTGRYDGYTPNAGNQNLKLQIWGGKVMIGTSLNWGKLNIGGDVLINNTTHTQLLLTNNGNNAAQFGVHSSLGILIHNYYANAGIAINNNGNVLMGVNPAYFSAAYKLHVVGVIYSTEGFRNTTYSDFSGDSCVFRGANDGQFVRVMTDGLGVCASSPYGTLTIGKNSNNSYIYDNVGSDIRLQGENGKVAIGNINASYKLHVSGDIYATGAVTALSDARKKEVLGDVKIGVEQIANAPAVQFLWLGERAKEGLQVGTLAQYWQAVLPEVVMDKGGELSMQYGVAALVSAIITARKVVDHERRISELEKENERLRTEVEQLRLN